MSSLDLLAERLREQGGLLATLLCPPQAMQALSSNGETPALQLAGGPRVAGAAEEYGLLIEAIYEGYLLHYGQSRLVRTPDVDLALLAGDQLYAVGLSWLVRLGDLEAVVELADVITLCALAHGAGESELADAVWRAGIRAVGWGSTAEHAHAKALARAGAPSSVQALKAVWDPSGE